MPGKYDTASRTIIVETDFDGEAELATTTLINGVVCDLLCQTNPEFVRFPELMDLAVVSTGLGMIRSNIALVSKTAPFWDSTQWDTVPRPFLNAQTMAYANAIAAWVRGESAPAWANDLTSEVRKPMKASLKYLCKTNDSFFNPVKRSTLGHSQNEWWKIADDASVSTQVNAVRQLSVDGSLSDQHETLLVKKLQSGKPAVVLNTIVKTEQTDGSSERIVDELRQLVSDRHEEVRSKAVCALTRLNRLDERTIESAVDMLDSSAKHNVFAAVFALGSQDEIADEFMPQVDRAFMRALKSCDYEFVGLFASGYNRWLPDAKFHAQRMLQEHDPELLEIALDALNGTPEQLVSLG